MSFTINCVIIIISKKQTTAIERSIYTTLKYIDSMFDNDRVPDQWTAQEKLDHFQHIVFRLIEENSWVRRNYKVPPFVV